MPLPFPFPLAQAAPSKGAAEIIDGLARTPLSQVVLFVAVLTAFRVALAPTLAKTPPHLRGVGYRIARGANELCDAVVYAGVFVFLIIRPFGVQAFRIPSGSMWPTLYVDDFVVANKAIYRYTDPKKGDIVVFRPPATAVSEPDQIDAEGNVKVDFIKRCVGTPGDVVELRDGILYVNGEKSPDPTKHYSTSPDLGHTFVSEPPEEAKKASFKLVTYKGRVIPLNYTSDSANSGRILDPAGKIVGATDESYQVSSEFAVDLADQDRVRSMKPEPVPAGYYLMMGDNRNNSYDGRGWGLVPRASIIGRSEFTWLPLSRMGRTPSVEIAPK